jgi:hypothetical protein
MTNIKSTVAGFLTLIFAAAIMAQTSGGASSLERLIPFEVTGAGTGGTNASSGIAKGDPVGVATYTTTFSNAGDSLTTNGGGGFCIRGSGAVILTTSSGSVLYLEQVGLNCNTSMGGGGSNATDNATFVINPTLSTGRFAGATGTGTVVTGQYGVVTGTGPAFLRIDGILKLN